MSAGEFEAQRFAIDLIALLAAGIFSVVVRGHFLPVQIFDFT
jgi:hypothetical protein